MSETSGQNPAPGPPAEGSRTGGAQAAPPPAKTEPKTSAARRADEAATASVPRMSGGAAPTEALDSYRRNTDAIRDTTKWLLSVVPVAGAIVTLGTLVPRLAGLDADDPDRVGVLTWLIIASACAGVTVVFAARVLTATPVDWGDVMRTMAKDSDARESPGGPRGRQLQAEADRHGVVRLYGYQSTSKLLEDLAVGDPAATPSAVAAGNALIDFATLRVVRGRFRWFLSIGGVAAVGGAVCVVIASFFLAGQESRLSDPAAVQLVPNSDGLQALTEVGCEPGDSRVDAIAVSGAWDEPEVVIDDDGCDPARLDWEASWGQVVPVP